MRKVLIGVLVVCISLGLASAAMAETTTSYGGQVVFGIFGDQGCCPCGDCQFYFNGGDQELWYQVTQTCGPWGGEVKVGYDSGEDPQIDVRSASLWYDGGTWRVTAYPNGVDNGVFDLETCDGDNMGGLNSAPGLKFETSADAFDLYVIVNNACECDNTPEWSFAGGIGFDMDGLGIDFVYNSDQMCQAKSTWGIKGTYNMDSLSLTGEYGCRQHEGYGDPSYAWYGNATWTMDSGDSVALTYHGGPTSWSPYCDQTFSRVTGEYTHVLDSCMNLVLGVKSVSGCCGYPSTTSGSETYWWAKLVCNIG